MAVSKSAGVCRSSRWCFSFWNLKVNVLIQLVFIFNTVLRNTEMPGETKGLGHGPLLGALSGPSVDWVVMLARLAI